MSRGQLAALAAAALLLFWAVGAYNRLVALRSRVAAAWQQLDEALQQRAQAVPALVSALREALVGEGAALDALLSAQAQVTACADLLRARPLTAEAAQALAHAEALLAAAAARVRSLVELQSDLADSPALQAPLQILREAEPRLAFARQLFNDAAQAHDEAIGQWPARLLAGLFGFRRSGRL